MRTLIDIGEAELKALDRIAKAKRVSRAAVIREAVDDFLGRSSAEHTAEAFGLWGNRVVDGLAYQEKIRSEW
ncbi:CopG family transcriptional regulator [Rhizobium sp. BK251]|uniref:ribbon-helix-helix domain-containing protein n=1 Tax=Rhizobium sp. BK251 TaxID=2512125 RepID=UPI0010491C9F|nr:CopG family transcriptional regulator [Rhizobium sp. BK251]TCL76002.1 ribbon-helix-helix CopG family protein [Rhizobium sp. BK251]